ncbi:MAG: type II toxin-antitoxin system Phd/YefM family antitoxin [Planctomycetes bacterium]|nr:type II toxin-antitoxin system Phd/YefM family antitoxin [Planctomycetota bacterium]
MIRINIHEAKTHLSKYLARVEKGEAIVLCKRNVPIAEIRPIPRPGARKRPVGFMKGRFTVPAAFFEPLPEETLRAFEGRDA